MAEAYIIDTVRTPVGKRGGSLSQIHPADLGAHTLKALVERTGIDAGAVDDVVMGCLDTIGSQAGDVGAGGPVVGRLQGHQVVEDFAGADAVGVGHLVDLEGAAGVDAGVHRVVLGEPPGTEEVLDDTVGSGSGAAPISQEVMRWYVALGIPIFEIYAEKLKDLLDTQ